jgi:hypothetical protein
VARYATSIGSSLEPDAALAYLAEFSSAATWDPSVVEAHRVGDGPVSVGSRFHIVSKVAGSTVPLDYQIVELVPGERVALRAVTKRLTSNDTITVVPTPTGSVVTYRAELDLHGAWRVVDPLLSLAFKRLGDKARDGLRAALNPPS